MIHCGDGRHPLWAAFAKLFAALGVSICLRCADLDTVEGRSAIALLVVAAAITLPRWPGWVCDGADAAADLLLDLSAFSRCFVFSLRDSWGTFREASRARAYNRAAPSGGGRLLAAVKSVESES